MTTKPGYLAAVLRHWPVILILAVLGVVGAFGYTRVATPVYSSTAQVLVAVQSDGTTTDRLQGATYIDQILPTYTSAVSSSLVLNPVISQLGLDTTLDDFRENVSATSETGTALITITATADSAAEAQKTATAVTTRFVSVAPGIVSPIAAQATATPSPTESAEAQQTQTAVPAVVDLTVVDRASLPLSPVSPKTLLSLALGLIAGLLVGVAVALARHAVDRRLRTEAEVEAVTGAPVVGRLPRLPEVRNGSEPASTEPWSESVRSLRNALFTWGGTPRILQFASATSGEGATDVVLSLAASLARSGARTVVVDADLRSPRVGAALGVATTPGLAEALSGADGLSSLTLASTDLAELRVIAASPTPDAGDLVASHRLRGLLEHVAADSDIVLVDSPAASETGDAQSVSNVVTDVLLVVALGQVTDRSIRRAVDRLTANGRALAGVILLNASAESIGETTPAARATAGETASAPTSTTGQPA